MASDFPTYCGDRSLQATDRSHESTSRKQFLGRCLLARPDGVLPVSGDGQKEECRREAATSRFSLAESPKRIPDLMTAPPLQNRFTSDGVASTCRMHRVNRDLTSTSTLFDKVHCALLLRFWTRCGSAPIHSP
jgi:hypothetical protein